MDDLNPEGLAEHPTGNSETNEWLSSPQHLVLETHHLQWGFSPARQLQFTLPPASISYHLQGWWPFYSSF